MSQEDIDIDDTLNQDLRDIEIETMRKRIEDLQASEIKVQELQLALERQQQELEKLHQAQQTQSSFNPSSQNTQQRMPSPMVQPIFLSTTIKISDYSGFKEENLENWIREAQGVLEHEIKSLPFGEDPMRILRGCLKHDARLFLFDQKKEDVDTAEKLFDLLRKRFHSPKDPNELENEFLFCRQNNGEPIDDFAKRISETGRRWKHHISEKELVHAFARSLHHLSLREAAGPATNMNDAILRVKKKEAHDAIRAKEFERDKLEKRKTRQTALPQLSLAISEATTAASTPTQTSTIPSISPMIAPWMYPPFLFQPSSSSQMPLPFGTSPRTFQKSKTVGNNPERSESFICKLIQNNPI